MIDPMKWKMNNLFYNNLFFIKKFTVANPCIRIVDAMNIMKYPEHSKYAKIGRSPWASRIHDTSQENAPK